jgi:D-ribose pyranase
MKKTTLLNAELSYTIATLGHTDMLVIADAGLPIPPETGRIDLALTEGVPSAEQTLRVVLEEMQVEKAILAVEVGTQNPDFLQAVKALLPGVPLEFLPHAEFKALCREARAVVRTGEFSPYANVILLSGVVF